jgi:hypothetical protein
MLLFLRTLKIGIYRKIIFLNQQSSGMWRHVDIALTGVLEERIASIFKVERKEENPRARNQRKVPTFSRQSAHRWRHGCQPYAPAALYPHPELPVF